MNVTEQAMSTQSYAFSTVPSLSVEWVTDDKNLSSNSQISVKLQNYYTKVARGKIHNYMKSKGEF